MADYYVSATGDDSNPGTYASPWRTLDRVNAALNAGVGLMNRVLFKRGEIFFGKLRPPNLDPKSAGWLRFGAYGESDLLPIISGYKVLNLADGWVQHDAETWRLNYSSANHGITYTGSGAVSENPSMTVGFLKIDGRIYGRGYAGAAGSRGYRALSDLQEQWDFYSDGTTLYVRSIANPTTLAGDIQCSYDMSGVEQRISGSEIADLTIEGYGECGVNTTDCERVRVLRCAFRELGGSWGDSNTRYGNGVQAFSNTRDLYCEYNSVSDVYDAAFSIQGGYVGGNVEFRNITWRRNLVYRCTQAEEYAYFGGLGPGFVNCTSENNSNLFLGYNWGFDDRTGFARGNGQQTYGWGDPGSGYSAENMSISRNVYYDCRTSFVHWAYPPSGLSSDYNLILLRPGIPMEDQRTSPVRVPNPATVERASDWIAETRRELHSQVIILPENGKSSITDSDVSSVIEELSALAPAGQVGTLFGANQAPPFR